MPPEGPENAKPRLRAAIRTTRAARGDEERAAAAAAITARVLALPELDRSARVALTIALPTEPATHGVVDALVARGVTILAPRVDPEGGMTWVAIDASTTWSVGPFGIAEPQGLGGPLDADVVLVPALAVTPSGARLGQGGGYFDRALAQARAAGRAPLTVAVVFDDEVLEDLPAEPHDERVAIIVTPVRTLRC